MVERDDEEEDDILEEEMDEEDGIYHVSVAEVMDYFERYGLH